ncbi:hypothetical protein BJX61DRAFT_542467 [Aspergillus egyptiacus]|nr:hypothetical protein BJX61DRAFT_542467 [Aspergillus egyptiacus]
MYTSAILSLALALTSHAIPLSVPNSDATIQRRSSDYQVVNVGGMPNPPQPAVETVTETVTTAPDTPPETVTVRITATPSASPTSTPVWSTSTFVPSSSAAVPTPTPVASTGEETIPRGFTAMDRLARAFGRSIESHLKALGDKHLTTPNSGLRVRDNETAAASRLRARG